MNQLINEKSSLIKAILNILAILCTIQVIRLVLYQMTPLAGSTSGLYQPYGEITFENWNVNGSFTAHHSDENDGCFHHRHHYRNSSLENRQNKRFRFIPCCLESFRTPGILKMNGFLPLTAQQAGRYN
jgi:hypothetical protein